MNNHGGKRPGAGRKLKYGCKTVILRVPEPAVPMIKELIASHDWSGYNVKKKG